MRTRFLSSAGMLSAALTFAGGVAATGCDAITAGQPGEDPGPPKLLKVIVQDERPSHFVATDILDNRPLAKCTVCDDAHPGCKENPCTPSQYGYPAGECSVKKGEVDGECPNPLAAGPVTIGDAVAAGGNSIRLVFSKLLDPSIEEVTKDKTNGQYNYKLAEGIVKLIGPDGMEVKLAGEKAPGKGFAGSPPGAYWDPAGSMSGTSDTITAPFGPAIVMKPAGQLSPGGKYKIVLDTSRAVDRKKQTPVAADGKTKLPNPYEVEFTVEEISVTGATPDVTAEMAEIAPNDAIQIAFNSGVDEATAVVTLKDKDGKVIPIVVFSDVGGFGGLHGDPDPMDVDPTACGDNFNDHVLNIIAVDTADCGPSGKNHNKKECEKYKPVKLKEGEYTLTFTALKDDILATSGAFSFEAVFAVAGMPTDPAEDPSAAANFLLPDEAPNGAMNGHCEKAK
ncbi:MAG: hypothetical protein EXR72_13340 [Myxococcales bacterium]|nr:hypothetical protein [Myxococcales bacterium]